MHIKIRNRVITTPVQVILETAQKELRNGKLKDIDRRNKDNILITCPVHSDGLESNPSCRIFLMILILKLDMLTAFLADIMEHWLKQ